MILVLKNKKYPFLKEFFVVEIFTQYSHNFYAVFGKFFLKMINNLICVLNPVVTIHFFAIDLQYQLKQKWVSRDNELESMLIQ